MREVERGLIFANLVDFDTQYGHRNDVAGYAANLERFDAAAGRAAAERSGPTTCWSSPPTTATIRRRRAPITRASTCRCWRPGARVPAGVDLGTRGDLRRPRADARRGVRRRRGFAGTARASCPRARVVPSRAHDRFRDPEPRATRARAPGAARRRAAPRRRGRLRPEPEDDIRPAFQRDRDRIIHCKAFRRLKHKTQVFFAPGRRPLPDAAHAHARGVADRAHDREGAAPERGADRGHRARARPRPHAVRPRGRARARTSWCPAASTTTSRACASSTCSRGTAQGLNLTWEVRDGIAQHSKGKLGAPGRRAARAAGADARRADRPRSPTSSPTSTTTSTMPMRAGPARARRPASRRRGSCSARPRPRGSARW